MATPTADIMRRKQSARQMLKSIEQKDETPAYCGVVVRSLFTELAYRSSSLSRRLNSWRILQCPGGPSSIARVGFSRVWHRIWKRRAGLVVWLLVVGGLNSWSLVDASQRWFILGRVRVKFNSICPLIASLIISHSRTRLASGPTLSDGVV